MATTQKSANSSRERQSPALSASAAIEFGREICGSLEIAEQREWLVTNGIGGYASGTVSGNLTRRYHGLLIAALHPPVGRTQLVAKLDEAATYDSANYPLATNRWASGAVDPKGYLHIESFRLEGTTPLWRFALADALLEKRIWMRQGENTSYVQYSMVRGSSPLRLTVKALVNYRDFHSSTHAGDWRMRVESVSTGIRITAFDGATPFYLLSADTTFKPTHEWCRDCFLPEERARGLDDHEDHLLAATVNVELSPSQSVAFMLTTNPQTELNARKSHAEHIERERDLHGKWSESDAAAASPAPSWVRQLILAADQFIVTRSLPQEPDGRSIIAGYHWFGDWGRDTMIALPGLTLTTGRPEIARKILFTFARYVDAGMLPNNFPDASGQPEYNSLDAALWYFQAVRQYFETTKDTEALHGTSARASVGSGCTPLERASGKCDGVRPARRLEWSWRVAPLSTPTPAGLGAGERRANGRTLDESIGSALNVRCRPRPYRLLCRRGSPVYGATSNVVRRSGERGWVEERVYI